MGKQNVYGHVRVCVSEYTFVYKAALPILKTILISLLLPAYGYVNFFRVTIRFCENLEIVVFCSQICTHTTE